MYWRTIPGFSAYEVSEQGDIRRLVGGGRYSAGTVISPRLNDGYLIVDISDDARCRRKVGTHHAVALAFLGAPPSDKHVAAHSDGKRINNHYSNLKWSTVAENNADLILHGTLRAWGVRMILTPENVSEIRRRYTGKMGEQSAFAREFGVGKTIIHRIVHGQRWVA